MPGVWGGEKVVEPARERGRVGELGCRILPSNFLEREGWALGVTLRNLRRRVEL